MKKTNADSVIRVVDAASGRELSAGLRWAGDDLVVVVGGGERPHVGSLVLAQPAPSKRRRGAVSASCSVLTIPPHKEEVVARGIAVALCEALGTVVVVTAGVHDDGLDAAGVRCYLELGERLAERLVEQVGEGMPTATGDPSAQAPQDDNKVAPQDDNKVAPQDDNKVAPQDDFS